MADLAGHASVSVRTLNRRFRAETGLSPLQWLLQLRIDRARELLETTDMPLSVIAHHTGIGTVDSLRDHLIRKTGLTPSAYRAAFTHRIQVGRVALGRSSARTTAPSETYMRSAVASSQESMDSPGTGTTRTGSLRAVTAAAHVTNLTSRGWAFSASGPDLRFCVQKVRTANDVVK